MTYRGRCHCGACDFELTSEPITAGLRCNCSICVRRGTVMSVAYYPPEAVQLHGAASLTAYQWGDHDVRSYFCPTCGIYVFHEVTAKPGHLRFNLGCLEGVDPLALPVTVNDGAAY